MNPPRSVGGQGRPLLCADSRNSHDSHNSRNRHSPDTSAGHVKRLSIACRRPISASFAIKARSRPSRRSGVAGRAEVRTPKRRREGPRGECSRPGKGVRVFIAESAGSAEPGERRFAFTARAGLLEEIRYSADVGPGAAVSLAVTRGAARSEALARSARTKRCIEVLSSSGGLADGLVMGKWSWCGVQRMTTVENRTTPDKSE